MMQPTAFLFLLFCCFVCSSGFAMQSAVQHLPFHMEQLHNRGPRYAFSYPHPPHPRLDTSFLRTPHFSPFSGSILAMSSSSTNADEPPSSDPASTIPMSPDEVVKQAQESLSSAVAAGVRKIRCDLLTPGLNPILEDRFPFDEKQIFGIAFQLAETFPTLKTTMLFESQGTAASAQAYYQRQRGSLPPNIRLGVTAGKQVIRDNIQAGQDVTPDVSADDPADIYFVVRPKNSRGDSVILAVEQAVEKVDGATWVLLNPMLDDAGDAAGIGERDRQRAFLSQFESAYQFRGLFTIQRPSLVPRERGLILHTFGSTWATFRFNQGSYEKIKDFDSEPSRTQINSLRW